MSGQQNIDVFAQIQAICQEFRRSLKRREQRSIDEFLNRLNDAGHATLFQQLLMIEIGYRRQAGEFPTSAEYLTQFPQFARQIRQAFFEPSQESSVSGAESFRSEETFIAGMPNDRRLGDYLLIRELGRGGMGVVFEARHTQRNDLVALKTLPQSADGHPHPLKDADRLHRFRREFRALAELNHPHLVGMQTLEFADDQWFFTMDLIDGVDFLSYVRPQGELKDNRLRSVLPQLVEGISALHARNIRSSGSETDKRNGGPIRAVGYSGLWTRRPVAAAVG